MTHAQQDEDDAVDRLGRPLPLVRMVDKAGREVVVRDAVGLSTMHYGHGMEFADDGMTYAKALTHILGEDVAGQVLVDVPAEDDGGESGVGLEEIVVAQDSSSDYESD